MDKQTSIFLDLCRFSAALAVFIGHVSGRAFTGGLLWQLGLFMHTGVMVFFVLSGFVIAYVTDTRETGPAHYASARLSRLYSVLLPAILITVIADYIGLAANADFYFGGPWGHREAEIIHYLATLSLYSYPWGYDLSVGSNGVVWTLFCEASYYLMFGLYLFLRGPKRWLVLVSVALLIGPQAISLFPLWLLGVLVYHLAKSEEKLTAGVAGLFFLIGMASLIATPFIREAIGPIVPSPLPKMLLADYADGLAFALALYGFARLPVHGKNWVLRIKRPAQYLGSLTFALYMFHLPLIKMIAAIGWAPPSSLAGRALILLVPLGLVILLSGRCDDFQKVLRAFFLRHLSRSKATQSA